MNNEEKKYGTPMTMGPEDLRDEIKRKINVLNKNKYDLAASIHDFHRKVMYKNLGYKTLGDCVRDEFGITFGSFSAYSRIGRLMIESSPECVRWIRSVKFSGIVVIANKVSDKNWRQWKSDIGNLAVADIRRIVEKKTRPFEMEKVRGETKSQKALHLMRDGFSSDFVANSLGLKPGDLECSTKQVHVVLDAKTYDALKEYAKQNDQSVGEEIAFILTEMIKDEQEEAANG